MARQKLFNADETYTELGSQLCDEAGVFAAEILHKYSGCPTRDVVTIANSAIEYQAVFARVERQMSAQRRKKVREQKKQQKAKRSK